MIPLFYIIYYLLNISLDISIFTDTPFSFHTSTRFAGFSRLTCRLSTEGRTSLFYRNNKSRPDPVFESLNGLSLG